MLRRTRSSSSSNDHRRFGQQISLAERVYQSFKKDIISGAFKPGEALSESLLGKHYSTSRTPVREAAARLQRENLIRIVPQRGYFVRLVSVPELNALYEYRGIIECAAAELAAKKDLNVELLKKLKRLSAVRYEAGNRASHRRFIEADTDFHVTIARMTRNEMLIAEVSDLRSHIERLLYAAIKVADYGTILSQEHSHIYQAIRNRNPQLARKLMLEHVTTSKSKVLQLL